MITDLILDLLDKLERDGEDHLIQVYSEIEGWTWMPVSSEMHEILLALQEFVDEQKEE